MLQTKSLFLAGSAACALLSQTAHAQATGDSQEVAEVGATEGQASTPIAADDKLEEVGGEEITVTGTRITRDGFEAPTPVSVITSEQIQRAAPVSVADYVNQLPALMGGESPRTPRGTLAGGTAGQNILDLRNLGPTRTLVLLNGRRVTPSNVTGVTDINVLPTSLVSRVDIVTGGASAAWGSDAVSGVVNFVLDTKYTGVKGLVQGGISTRGDAENFSGELSYGTSVLGDRGHLLLSGRYSKSYAAYVNDRSWFEAYKIFANPTPGAQPARLVVPFSSLLVTDEGLIASGPLRGTFFDPAGNLGGTNFQFPPIVSGIFAGGDRAAYSRLADQSRYSQVNVPVEQGSIYGRFSYDVTDNLTAFVEGSWSKAHTDTTIANFFRTGNTSIDITNFYLPPEVRSAMVAAGVTSIPLSTSNVKLGVLRSAITRENFRVLGGVEGKLGDNWKYSVSYQYGRTTAAIRSPNNIRPARYALAVDAVANPSNPTQPICRSTLSDPTNGCVPLNPFGSVPISAAQSAYILGNSTQDLVYSQEVATATLSGDLFDLPAGPLSVATGAEYRRERATAVADELSLTNGYYAGNYKPFTGEYSVKEAFLELGVPVLKESSLGYSLDLNGAVRITDYSTSGSVVTWKLGAIYSPIEDVQIRFTRSRDIRAPNLNELFQTGTVGTQNVSDPFRSGANAQFLQTTRGNPGLEPERADTLTAGVVVRPRFLPGLGISVDYYDIKINGAIATNSPQFTVNRCFAGDALSCSQITRNSSGVISGIVIQPFNALAQAARGVDIELSYRSALGDGNIELRALANYTAKLDTITATNTISRAGEVGNNAGAGEGVPRWRGLATATYTRGPFTGQLKGRFVGATKMDRQWTSADVNMNNVPAVAYLDVYASYKLDVGKGLEIFVAGDNILDKAPPVVTNQDNSNLLTVATNPFVYDVVGASVRAGVRFSF